MKKHAGSTGPPGPLSSPDSSDEGHEHSLGFLSDETIAAIIMNGALPVEKRRQALELVALRHHAILVAYATGWVGDQDIASDLVQDSFVFLLEKSLPLCSLPYLKIPGYLFGITRNKIKRFYNLQGKIAPQSLDDNDEFDGLGLVTEEEDKDRNIDRKAFIENRVDKLLTTAQRAFVKAYLPASSQDRELIAKQFGYSQTKARKVSSRASIKLRDDCDASEYDDLL